MSDQIATAAAPPPFSQLLQQQRKGALHQQLSERMSEAALAANELNKVATVTLTLKIVPSKDGETVSIVDKVTSKIPEPETKPSTYFLGANGELSRNNPAQDELPLRKLPDAEAAQVRRVGGDS